MSGVSVFIQTWRPLNSQCQAMKLDTHTKHREKSLARFGPRKSEAPMAAQIKTPEAARRGGFAGEREGCGRIKPFK